MTENYLGGRLRALVKESNFKGISVVKFKNISWEAEANWPIDLIDGT